MICREFSTKCCKCRQRSVALAKVPYTLQVDYEGRKYQVSIPEFVVPRCAKCGNISHDHEATRQIDAAIRSHLGLLSPEQIQSNRLALGLNQQQLADMLGVSLGTFEWWETGMQIQERAHDKFLRAFFKIPELRQALANSQALQLSESPQPAA